MRRDSNHFSQYSHALKTRYGFKCTYSNLKCLICIQPLFFGLFKSQRYLQLLVKTSCKQLNSKYVGILNKFPHELLAHAGEKSFTFPVGNSILKLTRSFVKMQRHAFHIEVIAVKRSLIWNLTGRKLLMEDKGLPRVPHSVANLLKEYYRHTLRWLVLRGIKGSLNTMTLYTFLRIKWHICIQ